MANIKIPNKFKTKLESNQFLDGIVKTTLSNFGEILEENKLFFFADYTNHGIKHIEDVLASSFNILTDESIEFVLDDKNIGYYILSVILHDIGMHINLDGFKCLIDGEYDDIIIQEFDSLTWLELWNDFLNEARKFSSKQLKAIFGNERTIIRTPPIDNIGEITENDKKLIGEFLRRHHARLAHEIAVNGFPAKPQKVKFAEILDFNSLNLIGLIARSHGMELRKCTDYIEDIFGRDSRRLPIGIHATFLMIVLRIADYIQIDNTRTSKVLLKSRTFASPVSELEHNSHASIENVDLMWNDDPERIYVTALPLNSSIFLKLKKLFKDIQYELDISWAVLGELYGNIDVHYKPKIKYRRITSNLESTKFTNSQKYVAENFQFKTNEEIIKLLVAPLYGDKITYGVRELIQNAVDACKEREFYESKKLISNYNSKVSVKIFEDINSQVIFEIIDNGLGMDVEIIKNYFLSAGASYRKSLEWQKEFIDDDGNAQVRKSGRFGIGILSAFLIGNKIMIETRRPNSTIGYKFQANLNTEQIDVIKDSKLSEGTKIMIVIEKNKIEEFEERQYKIYFDWTKWFTLSNPKVEYYFYDEKTNPYKNFDPDINEKLPKEWNSIDAEGYNKILWTYSSKYTEAKFTCNGILIPDGAFINAGLFFNLPKISVFDNNALLPLSLDRNSISDRLSFNNLLLEDIYKDFIAYLLVYEQHTVVTNDIVFFKTNKVNHPGTKNDYPYLSDTPYGFSLYDESKFQLKEFLNTILVSKEGFILNYNYFIQKLKIIEAILVQFDNAPPQKLELNLKNKFLLYSENRINSIPDYTSAIESNTWNTKEGRFDDMNSRIFLKTEKFNYLFNSKVKRTSNWLKQKCNVLFKKYDFTCIEIDKPGETIITDRILSKYSTIFHFVREYSITCPFEGDNIFNQLLEKYIGENVVIPYSLEERKKLYPLAFNELKRYMQKYIEKDKE